MAFSSHKQQCLGEKNSNIHQKNDINIDIRKG